MHIGNSLLSTLSGSIPFTCRYLGIRHKKTSGARLLFLPLQYNSVVWPVNFDLQYCCLSEFGREDANCILLTTYFNSRNAGAFCPKPKPNHPWYYFVSRKNSALLYRAPFCATNLSPVATITFSQFASLNYFYPNLFVQGFNHNLSTIKCWKNIEKEMSSRYR